MNSGLKTEYRKTLSDVLTTFRDKPYEEFLGLAESKEVHTFSGKTVSGSDYQIEIQTFFDDTNTKSIRVIGDISPDPRPPLWGFIPLYFSTASEDFIMTPERHYVNE